MKNFFAVNKATSKIGRVYYGSVKKNTRLYRQILAMNNNLA
ncbi:hypothetical protein [uncultured Eubacterium sp.]|nr:hypothetical protein [uncultured Eubacterium sp.]